MNETDRGSREYGDHSAIVHRPFGQLQDFPLEIRWEVTRRHPYYLVFWSEASHYWKNELGDNPAQKLLRHASALMLLSIGVTAEPVAPSTTFQELTTGKLDPAFLTGSVQPITLRSIVATLINALPPA